MMIYLTLNPDGQADAVRNWAAIIGQLLASLIIDHFGLFGGLKIAISPARLLGVILLLAGLFFVQKED